ncbi:MAG: tetratricopeptide repeat protein [Chloroflexi bacterium]|nr:tetratricopeptide repeat protein [Chloroflexota bacterium]
MAPTTTIDALERALVEAGGTVVADVFRRIELLNALAWELSDSDASHALEFAETAYALSDAQLDHDGPYRRGLAYSLRTQGYLDMRTGAYPRGMERLLRAQALFEALRTDGAPPIEDGLGDVFDGIAGIYAQMGDYPEALDYSYKMLALAEARGDLRRILNARNNLAVIFAQTGEFERAIEIQHQNARDAVAIGYQRIEAIAYLNLSDLYLRLDRLTSALAAAEQGLAVVRAVPFAIFEVYALDRLGRIRLKLGDHAGGLDALEQALAAARRLGSQHNEAVCLTFLGRVYNELGQLDQARDFLEQAIAVAESIQSKPEQITAHLALAELFERQDEPALALAHVKQHHALKELVAGEKANQRLKVLQVIHDTATARKEALTFQQRADELQRIVDERTAELRDLVASLEQRVAARTAEVATFFDLTLLAGQAGDLADVFLQVLPRIIEVTRSDAISVHLLDESRSELHLAGQLNLGAGAAAIGPLKKLPRAFRRWLAQPADPLLSTDLAIFTTLPAAFRALGLQTYLGVQIKVGSRVEGVLGCYRTTDRGYGIDEVALVTALAEQIGMMLAAQQLRQNTRALAIVEERQRLARDMHDSISQTLYSLTLFAQTGLEAAEDGDGARLALSLEKLKKTALQALREMRLLLYELRPADLQREGLVRALELRLDAVEHRTDLQISARLDELTGLDPRAEAELYYIVVEALNNVLKHAAASEVALLLTQVGHEVRVEVCDDGRGFDVDKRRAGMGLRNIAERVARLNGWLELSSTPGEGTRLEVAIPITA